MFKNRTYKQSPKAGWKEALEGEEKHFGGGLGEDGMRKEHHFRGAPLVSPLSGNGKLLWKYPLRKVTSAFQPKNLRIRKKPPLLI